MISCALNCRQLWITGNDVQQAADFLSTTVFDSFRIAYRFA